MKAKGLKRSFAAIAVCSLLLFGTNACTKSTVENEKAPESRNTEIAENKEETSSTVEKKEVDNVVQGAESGEINEKPTISLAGDSTIQDNVIDCTKGDKIVGFHVEASDQKNIAEVNLYVNDELERTSTKAPYTMEYRIDKMADLCDSENYEFVAKAKLNDGTTVTSNVLNVKAVYHIQTTPVIEIVTPADNTVLNTTKGNTSLDITVKRNPDEEVKYIHVYAEEELVDRLGADGGTVTYHAPTGKVESETGKTKVEIVAVATLESGKSVACKPITIILE